METGLTGTGARSAPLIEIEEPAFSVRVYNLLRRMGVRSLGELSSKTKEELKQNSRRFGQKAISEIREILYEYGLSLKGEESQEPTPEAANRRASREEAEQRAEALAQERLIADAARYRALCSLLEDRGSLILSSRSLQVYIWQGMTTAQSIVHGASLDSALDRLQKLPFVTDGIK